MKWNIWPWCSNKLCSCLWRRRDESEIVCISIYTLRTARIPTTFELAQERIKIKISLSQKRRNSITWWSVYVVQHTTKMVAQRLFKSIYCQSFFHSLWHTHNDDDKLELMCWQFLVNVCPRKKTFLLHRVHNTHTHIPSYYLYLYNKAT